MISCHQLSVARTTGESPLFEDASLEIERGEWAEIIGPAGSGKSVLQSIVTLEARPETGSLVVAGRNLERVDRSELPELRRSIGCCRQPPEFLEERSVLENLVLPLVVRGETEEGRRRGEELLGSSGMEAWASVTAGRLSFGQQWLLGVLRAVIGAPALVVIDGALEALSESARGVAVRKLREVHDRETTVVVFGREPSGVEGVEGPTFRIRDGALERREP